MRIIPINRKKKERKKKITHLTMLVIPHSHGVPIKNYCIPMWFFRGFMLVSISCILTVAYFTTGFFLLRYTADENKELKQINTAQAEEISELKGLAGSMSSKLEYLIQLDREVRVKVGLSQSVDEEIQDTGQIKSSRGGSPYRFAAMNVPVLAKTEPMTLTQQLVNSPSVTQSVAVLGANNAGAPKTDALSFIRPENETDTSEDLKEQLAAMDSMLTRQEENINQLKTDVDKQLAYLQALPDAWPVQGRITSVFGWRRNPYSHKGREYHEGIDIATTYGAPIRAAGDGVVTFAGYKGAWGRMVLVSHGYGYVSQYAHNSSLLVKVGDKVKKGDVLARLGSTGRSTGPHLHFGVAKNGTWTNPMTLLDEAKKRGE
jgi:murein DD-endopeptidase MepM/ murein hydrolase activator NlpD